MAGVELSGLQSLDNTVAIECRGCTIIVAEANEVVTAYDVYFPGVSGKQTERSQFQIMRIQRDGLELKKEEGDDLLFWKAFDTSSVGQPHWRRAE